MSESPELHVNQSFLFAGAKRPKYLGRSNCLFNDESISKMILYPGTSAGCSREISVVINRSATTLGQYIVQRAEVAL